MLIRTVVAPLLSTNCYIVSDDVGRCVVVDPGAGVAGDVVALVRGHGLVALAVLATHGHVDHTWAAAELVDELDAPLVLHAGDEYRIADPFGSLGPLGGPLAAMGESAGMVYRTPERIEPFDAGADGTDLDLGQGGSGGPPFVLRAVHAPGHTQGSTLYLLQGHEGRPTALTGDVLFAGSIGRTDLPGGDDIAMAATLRRVAALDPATVVLPGHGPSSTISSELLTNPYLRTAR